MNYDALFDIFTSSSSTATAITTETNFAKHVAAGRGAAHGGLSNGELWLKCQHIDRNCDTFLSLPSASRTSGTSKNRNWRGLNDTYLEIM